MEKLLHGIAASPGIGVGRAKLYQMTKISAAKRETQDRPSELSRYYSAAQRFCAQLREKAEHIAPVAGQEQADILLSQAAMVQDVYFEEQVKQCIAAFQSAEAAVDTVCAAFIRGFSASQSEMFRQRAIDLQDLRDRLLRILLGLPEADLSNLPPETVLVADSLPPSVMTALAAHPVSGIVLCKEGKASHSVILARAMEIPTVVGAKNAAAWICDGEWVVVDGTEGTVLFTPSKEQLTAGKTKQAQYRQEREALNIYIHRPAKTADEKTIRLTAGVGSEQEARAAEKYGCDGIGLLRSEFLYLNRPTLPGEEEQFQAYRGMAQRSEQPLIIRTLDIGGDKLLPGLSWEQEQNPYLGCRGVRLYREKEGLFRTQVRAVLRAGSFGDVRLLLPMVTGVEELRWVKSVVRECEEELQSRGEPYREKMPLGVMVETAAAALVSDLLAEEADFFSIGLNDLTQYTLAVDRDNATVSHLYSYYDPSLLRFVSHVLRQGRAADIPVSICGQAAADPLYLPLLLGLGAEELNVQPSFLLPVRKNLSLWSLPDAVSLAEQALTLRTEPEVRALLTQNRRE